MAPPSVSAVSAVSSVALPLRFEHYVPNSVSFLLTFDIIHLYNYCSLFLLLLHLGMSLL
jgi:hypothetical protein